MTLLDYSTQSLLFLTIYEQDVISSMICPSFTSIDLQSSCRYEDVNDAQRLSVDPVMLAITGKKDKHAASANKIERFETGILIQKDNIDNLSDINGRWVQRAISKKIFAEILSRIERLRCYSV